MVRLGRERADQKAEQKRAVSQLNVEDQRAKESALQMYLDRMTELLLERNLRTSERNDEVRSIALVRTLSALRQLDGRRKGFLLQFLYESGLISASKPIITLGGGILGETTVNETVLSKADLSGAELSRIFLTGAYLTRVHLIGADLHGSHLGKANLIGADLREANLAEANLKGAKLSSADLRGAKLNGANLNEANLRSAKITSEQLANVKSLTGATMPDGTKHD